MTAPHMMLQEEMMNATAQGAELMAQMIRVSIFEQQQMPPPELLTWYFHDSVLRFIQEEYIAIYQPKEDSKNLVQASIIELNMIFGLCAKQKMYGAQHDLQKLLRTRLLHLPTTYDSTHEGQLPV